MRRIILIAILLVLMIGAAYKLFLPSTSPADKRLAGYLTGEMAGLTIAEEPVRLGDHIVARGDGSPVALKDMTGKALLINLWASWCIPCRVEMPELSRLQAELGDENFEVVAINVDRGGHLMAAEVLKEWNIEGLAVYAEPTGKIAFDLAGGVLPTSLIVDRKGRIRAQYLGPLRWDAPEAVALFTALKEGRI